MAANENQLSRPGRTAISRTGVKPSGEFYNGVITALTATASMLKQEIPIEQQMIWSQMLEPYPLPLIQKAFLLHMKRSNFLPTPHEIIELIEIQQREERERQAEARKKQEKRQLEEARDRGETFGWADILKKCRTVLSEVAQKALRDGKRMPAAPVVRVNDEAVVLIITPEKRRRAQEQALEAQRRWGSANPSAAHTDSRQA